MDRPLQACAEPGCSARVARGRCAMHAAPAPASAFTLRQGSRQARGYGADWERLRDWFLRQPENVLCRSCEAAGRTTIAQEVDHVVARLNTILERVFGRRFDFDAKRRQAGDGDEA